MVFSGSKLVLNAIFIILTLYVHVFVLHNNGTTRLTYGLAFQKFDFEQDIALVGSEIIQHMLNTDLSLLACEKSR